MNKIVQIFNDAVAAFNNGDGARAENLFRQVIAADSSHTPALNLLVVVLMGMERFAEAEPFIVRATALNQNSDVSFYNFGLISKRLNKLQQALENFDKALNLNPNVAETWNNRGTIFNDLKRYDLAVADFDKAIALNGLYADAHANKGKSLTLLKRYDHALAAYNKALSIKPDLEGAWIGRGNALADLKDYDGALAAYDKALSIKPDLENAWLGRGDVFWSLKRYEEAASAYNKALSIKPDLENAWLGLGNVSTDLKRHDEALAAYDKALAIEPDSQGAWLGRGNVFFAQTRDTEALECFDKALDLKQDFAEGHWNKALAKLSLGEYEEGWTLYEWRWKCRYFCSPNRDFRQPLWLNNFDISGKTLLVHAEQGLGDTIQFSRYLSFLTNTDAKIIFEVPKPLAALFKSQGWNCEVLTQGDNLPPFDAHCPLLSLPLAFKTTVATIPSKVPYIKAPQDAASDLFEKINRSTKPKIGLAWSGNPNFARGNDVSRPIPLSVLRSIMNEKCEWFRLQKDLRESDQEALASSPALKDLSHSFYSFAETAKVIAALDLVISIDSSPAHLAGAMGKPVWILLPFHSDFRWLRERTDSPWYPTARLYRQTKDGDWETVLNSVSEDLNKATGC